ncbi:hypothetical protein WJX75_008575 [Coccomyxa subellipsoidea]|uniref:Secreted protein n=1 Tax=Coccomyxa subellipsoidea TaxID=248742 RepID=A0ABR2YWS8_9CHLO
MLVLSGWTFVSFRKWTLKSASSRGCPLIASLSPSCVSTNVKGESGETLAQHNAFRIGLLAHAGVGEDG